MTIPFNAVFNSSLMETVYRVNAASLELCKVDAYFVNDHDRKHYISQYVEYLMFRQEKRKKTNPSPVADNYFGSLKSLPDGMDLQRSVRDEWA